MQEISAMILPEGMSYDGTTLVPVREMLYLLGMFVIVNVVLCRRS